MYLVFCTLYKILLNLITIERHIQHINTINYMNTLNRFGSLELNILRKIGPHKIPDSRTKPV